MYHITPHNINFIHGLTSTASLIRKVAKLKLTKYCFLQDTIEMVEDVEYENQIHCKVQMQKSCQFINSPAETDEQACHTMYHKECQTVYRPHMTKVNVRVCPEGAVERIFPVDNRKVCIMPT